MALGTPFDRLELAVLVLVAGVLAFAEPFLVSGNPGIRMLYFLLAAGGSILSATLVRGLRRRRATD